MDEPLTGQELKTYEAFMEKIRAEKPKQSCDMVRAWIKLNIDSSMTKVQDN
jgi:hypothetical protein